jgi:hypothetical protein
MFHCVKVLFHGFIVVIEVSLVEAIEKARLWNPHVFVCVEEPTNIRIQSEPVNTTSECQDKNSRCTITVEARELCKVRFRYLHAGLRPKDTKLHVRVQAVACSYQRSAVPQERLFVDFFAWAGLVDAEYTSHGKRRINVL